MTSPAKQNELAQIYGRLISKFGEKMKLRMVEKYEKRGERGWIDSELGHLFNGLSKKIEALDAAIHTRDYIEFDEICADIANYSMMIGDKAKIERGEWLSENYRDR